MARAKRVLSLHSPLAAEGARPALGPLPAVRGPTLCMKRLGGNAGAKPRCTTATAGLRHRFKRLSRRFEPYPACGSSSFAARLIPPRPVW
ncbi:hypothetical protein Q31a_57320 [Aureliella helgolandensis]|uniref:Uncharacterized protein n=1 Tax=Aureliella helgolandensis TaxID=2527968 RepID=A0A518GFG7_9BACT|nr:hypothetical protein Q31a_57320 [Aureliella helgolandensis]